MERKSVERELKQRIQTGKIRREDVTRRLAELAFGKANDCVRLALEDEPRLDKVRKEHDHAMDDMRYFAATVLGERQEGVSAWAVERRR